MKSFILLVLCCSWWVLECTGKYCFPNDVLLYYRFNETFGTTIHDYSDNPAGVDLSLQGDSYVWDNPGLTFGANDALAVGYSANVIDAIINTNQYTVEVWLKLDMTTCCDATRSHIFSLAEGSRCGKNANDYPLLISAHSNKKGPTGRVEWRMKTTDAVISIICRDGEARARYDNIVQSNALQHLVFTWDGTQKRMYKNTIQAFVEAADTEFPPGSTDEWLPSSQIAIAAALNGNGYIGSGSSYYKLALWKRALTPPEIRQLYELGPYERCVVLSDIEEVDVFESKSKQVKTSSWNYFKFFHRHPYTNYDIVVTQTAPAVTTAKLAVHYSLGSVPTSETFGVRIQDPDPQGVYHIDIDSPSAEGFYVIAIRSDLVDITQGSATVSYNFVLQVPAPAITASAISQNLPTAEPLTYQLVIPGTNFAPSSTVTVDGVSCLFFDQTGSTSITCLLQNYEGFELPIVVHSPISHGQQSEPVDLNFQPPLVQSLNVPSTPTQGSTIANPISVAISGVSFGRNAEVFLRNPTGLTFQCAVDSQSHVLIYCSLPPGQGTIDVEVLVGGQQSQSNLNSQFSYEKPIVTRISPSVGFPGYTTIIEGSNFGVDISQAQGGDVQIGGTSCTSIPSHNHTHIECEIPSTPGLVTVTVAGQKSQSTVFFAFPGSELVSLFAPSYPTQGGVNLTLFGNQLSGVTDIRVGPNSCPIISSESNDTVIVCILPAGHGEGLSVVAKSSSDSNSLSLDYDPPFIQSVNPLHGPTQGNTLITIQGKNFGADTAHPPQVKMGTACAVQTFNHDVIYCKTPLGYGKNIDITVTLQEQSSSEVFRFSYDPPNITNVYPQPGPVEGGVLITFLGQNFGTISVGSAKVGTSTCFVASADEYTDSEINCFLPQGVGANLNATVSVSDQTGEPFSFSYSAPSISNIQPTLGPTTGVELTLSGNNFGFPSLPNHMLNVSVGYLPCLVTLHQNQEIQCVLPAGTGKNHEVIVNVGNQLSVDQLYFHFEPPKIDRLYPLSAPTNEMLNLTLTGQNFGGLYNSGQRKANVTIGVLPCPILYSNESQIICQIPEGTGSGHVVFLYVDEQKTYSEELFSYHTPQIVSVQGCKDLPNGETTECPPTNGNKVLLINGSNFGYIDSLVEVFVNDTICANPHLVVPHHSISCQLPDGKGLVVPVKVKVDGQSDTQLLLSYAGPIISSQSLFLNGNNPSNFVEAPTTQGSETVGMSGKYFGDTPQVYYGTVEQPYLYSCDNAVSSGQGTHLTCLLSPGVGKNMSFIVRDPILGQDSFRSEDTLSYPRPYIVPQSLRKKGTSTGSSGYREASSAGGFITINVLHIQPPASLLKVTYGPLIELDRYSCTDPQLVATADPEEQELSCQTPPGDGEGFFFVVTALNYVSLPSLDNYSYPVAPIIQSLEGGGCTQQGSRVIKCPTEGGQRITIWGQKFPSDVLAAGLSVTIGTQPCTQVASLGQTNEVSCILPHGAGVNVPITVISAGKVSNRPTLLDYEAPTLTSLGGCVTTFFGLQNCPREGGGTLSVYGNNFGKTQALVLVGSIICNNTQHVAGQEHRYLQCDLPPVSAASVGVFVIQNGGQVSLNSLQLSYVPCPKGSFASSQSSVECSLCLTGTFSSTPGQQQCTQCEAGFFAANNGSTTCNPCPKGKFSTRIGGKGPSFCQECNPGKFTNEEGAAVCSDCEIGKYRNESGTSSCERCAVGRFTSIEAQRTCEECAKGKFASAPGATVCSLCPQGSSSNTTASKQCTLCTSGTYASNSGSKKCTPCEIGRAEIALGQSSCRFCSPGTFSNVSKTTTCIPCPPGKSQPGIGKSLCHECIEGEFNPSKGQASCFPCPVGSFCNTTGLKTFVECFEGTFADDTNAFQCTKCPEGRISNTRGARQCKPCPAGSNATGEGNAECTACNTGRYQESTGQTGCTDCERGKYQSVTGQSTCILCASGYITNRTGLNVCGICEAGKSTEVSGTDRSKGSTEGQSTCYPCAKGYFSSLPGQGTCQPCSAGSFTNITGQTGCILCTPGRFAPKPASTECTRCGVGEFSAGKGALECALCDVGRYANVSTSTSCLACQKGTSQLLSGQSTCNPCTPGRISLSVAQPTCAICDTGKYSPSSGYSRCLNCKQGEYQPGSGRSRCLSCDPGSFSAAEGQAQCVQCESGSYQNETGQTRCIRCEVGRFSVRTSGLGAVICQLCNEGTFTNARGQQSCQECEQGKYAPAKGTTECTNCEKGKFGSAPGLFQCTNCSVGTYAPLTGTTACELCPEGLFANRNGSDQCSRCGEGQFQETKGKSFCRRCNISTAQPFQGQPSCNPCLPGTYADTPGLSLCKTCPIGRTQPAIGSASCRVCTAGTAATDGARECEKCRGNTRTPLDGMAACENCPLDSVANELHTQCICRVGTYAEPVNVTDRDVSGDFTCLECPEGALCDTPGQTRAELQNEPGWWRSGDENLVFYRCLIRAHCLSGSIKGNQSTPCSGNRDGPICANCLEGYHATSVTSDCALCPSKQESLANSIGISILIVASLVFMYYIVLRTDRKLMKDAKALAEHKKKYEWAYFVEEEENLVLSSVYDKGILDDKGMLLDSVPTAKPNFTYKMKIILGFFQITTNLALALDIPWPSGYQSFINLFALVNFDFMSWSNLGCVSTIDFYTRFLAITLTPVVLLILVSVFFLLPRYIQDIRDEQYDFDLRKAAQTRSKRKFWKLFLFTMFLIYPGVSATVLRLYVCREINGVKYLLADFSVECGTDKWKQYALIDIIFVVLYPIGIPLFFWIMLVTNKEKLRLPDVRVQLGFLYEAYAQVYWWFELADMANKLILTSIIAFVPFGAQLPFGIAFALGYVGLLLWIKPYVRDSDDMLHLFAQIEIFLMLLAGYVFVELNEFSTAEDRAMSAVLIMVTCGLLCLFIHQCWLVVKKMIKNRKEAKELAEQNKQDVPPEDEEGKVEDESTIKMTQMRLPRDAQMTRNPLWSEPQSSSSMQFAEAVKSSSGGGVELVSRRRQMTKLLNESEDEPSEQEKVVASEALIEPKKQIGEGTGFVPQPPDSDSDEEDINQGEGNWKKDALLGDTSHGQTHSSLEGPSMQSELSEEKKSPEMVEEDQPQQLHYLDINIADDPAPESEPEDDGDFGVMSFGTRATNKRR